LIGQFLDFLHYTLQTCFFINFVVVIACMIDILLDQRHEQQIGEGELAQHIQR